MNDCERSEEVHQALWKGELVEINDYVHDAGWIRAS